MKTFIFKLNPIKYIGASAVRPYSSLVHDPHLRQRYLVLVISTLAVLCFVVSENVHSSHCSIPKKCLSSLSRVVV